MLDEMVFFRDKIRQEKQENTYTCLEEDYGVNRYYLWNIINDDEYIPPERIQTILGIRIYKPAPTCVRCGAVHTTKRCTAGSNNRPKQTTFRTARMTLDERAEVLAISLEERKRRLLQQMPEWY